MSISFFVLFPKMQSAFPQSLHSEDEVAELQVQYNPTQSWMKKKFIHEAEYNSLLQIQRGFSYSSDS